MSYHELAAEYDQEHREAVLAFSEGRASPQQQILAYNWIVWSVCHTDAVSFRPEATGDRATAFREGERFVGNQIKYLTHPRALTYLENLAKAKAEKPKSKRGKPNEN